MATSNPGPREVKPTTTPAQQINSAMQTASAQSPALANPTSLGGPTAQKYQGMSTQQLANDLQQKAEQMKAAQAAMQQPSAQTQMAAQTAWTMCRRL